jgi:uncharacterized protein YbjT (DUF2867 family)
MPTNASRAAKSARLAVTGASGLIGAAVCRQLAGAGHDVLAVDKRPPQSLTAATSPARLVAFSSSSVYPPSDVPPAERDRVSPGSP